MKITFKNKTIIFVLAVIICGFIIAVAHLQYFDTRGKILELYGEKQVILAKQIALSLEKYFDERMQVLGVLANYHIDKNICSRPHNHSGEYIYKKEIAGHNILFLNKSNRMICVYPDQDGLDPSVFSQSIYQRAVHKQAPETSPKNGIIITQNTNVLESRIFIFHSVYDSTNEYKGLIGEAVMLNAILQKIITPFMQTFQAHAFVLSKQGEILYHPYHPQMTFKSLSDFDTHCNSCHNNFELERKMIKKGQGWGEKTDKGPKKLLSFASVSLAGTQWVVAVKSSYDVIANANRKQFWIFFILSGSMIVVVIMGTAALFKIKQRDAALENERKLRQKEQLALLGEVSTRIAHEIKNPLASLQTGIQLIESTLQMDEESHEYFQRLTGEIRRVDTIVKGLLSYAREEHLNREIIELDQLIERVIDLIKPTVKDKAIDWSFSHEEKNVSVCADEQKMEQVIWNLLINAVQAIKSDGRINIHLSENKNIVYIKISDTGAGISNTDLKQIFRPYFSTRSQGTGLGLAICKKIVQAHDGQIKIRSQEKKGAEVTITLPGKNA